MTLDYNKVWTVMNDLDSTVQKCKQINDMCDDMLATVYDWTDADEVIDSIDLLRGYSRYILRDLENKSIHAWNETVVKLNPAKTHRSKHGKDLDHLDDHIEDVTNSKKDWVDFWTSGKDVITNMEDYKSKDEHVHDSEGC